MKDQRSSRESVSSCDRRPPRMNRKSSNGFLDRTLPPRYWDRRSSQSDRFRNLMTPLRGSILTTSMGPHPNSGVASSILVDGEPVGQVTYNDIVERDGRRQVELDIWMRSEACCGKGYGTDALDALCRHLHEHSAWSSSWSSPPHEIHGRSRLMRRWDSGGSTSPLRRPGNSGDRMITTTAFIWSERTHEPQAGNLPRTAPIWTAVPSSRAAPSMVAEVSPTSTLC